MSLKKLSRFILLIITAVFVLSGKAYADDNAGVAISGSFYSYDYHVLQGGSVERPDINVVLFNNSSDEIRIKLGTNVPEGIEIIIEEGLVSIKPNQSITVPVSIHASSSIAPGIYDVAITCQQQKQHLTDTLNVSSLVSLDTQITVHKEASFIELTSTNKVGEFIESEIFINRVNDDLGVSPALYSSNGLISANIPAGKYEVTTFINQNLVHKDTFTLLDNQNLKKNLEADIIDISNFKLKKVFNNIDSQMESINIIFKLSNLVSVVNDTRLSLKIMKNDMEFETVDMYRINELIPGTNEFTYNYSPTNGWTNSDYSFEIEVYKDYYDVSNTVITNSVLIDESRQKHITVSNINNIDEMLQKSIPIAIILVLLGGIFYLLAILNDRVKNRDNFVPLEVPELLDELFYNQLHDDLMDEIEDSNISPDELKYDITSENKASDESTLVPTDESEVPEYSKEEIISKVIQYYQSLPKVHLCPICNGSGTTLYNGITEECVYCNGIGKVMNALVIPSEHLVDCVKCNAEGFIEEDGEMQVCTFCNGFKQTIISKGAIYIDRKKLKIHNITYKIIEEEIEKYLKETADIKLLPEKYSIENQ